MRADKALGQIEGRLKAARAELQSYQDRYTHADDRARSHAYTAGTSALLVGGSVALTVLVPPLLPLGVVLGGPSALAGLVSTVKAGRHRARRRSFARVLPDCEKDVANLEHDDMVARRLFEVAAERLIESRREEVVLARRRAEMEAARNQELEELERERAQAAEDLQRRTAFLKRAFVHWRNVAPDPEGYADLWWPQIIANREMIARDYQSMGTLGFTGDDCRVIAAWALGTLPDEVAYWLPEEQDQSIAHLTYILRRYCGDYYERILPRALDHQRKEEHRQRRLAAHDARLERQEKLLARSHRLESAYGDSRSPLTPLEKLAKRLPEEVRQNAVAIAGEALTISDQQAFNFEVARRERQRLEAEGLSPDEIDDRIAALELNLHQGTRPSVRRGGMVG